MRLALLLIGALLGAVIVLAGCTRETSGVAVAPPGTTALPRSDEDQIADVVDRFAQAWNNNQFDTVRDLMCDDMRSQAEFDEEALREARADAGRLNLTITELDITGDTAAAIIENNGDDPDDIAFQREGDEWKWCEY